MIDSKSRKDISLFKVLDEIFRMIIKSSPVYFIIAILLGILHGVSTGFNIFMTQKFFDTVSKEIGKKGAINSMILMGCLLGITLIIEEVLNGTHNFTVNNFAKIQLGYMGKKINKKTGNLDPIYFERSSFLDDINKANEGMENCISVLTVIMVLFSFYLPYFIFMSIYLYKLKPILAASLILIFIPVAITQIIKIKVFAELEDNAAPLRREYEYYEKCLIDKEYYKETRILGAFNYFKDLYLSTLKLLNIKMWNAEKKSGLLELGMKMITLLGYMSVLYLLFTALLKGEISIGAFGAVFASIGMMFSLMEEIICMHIGNITKSWGTIKNFIRFVNMTERKGQNEEFQGIPEIYLENVSFTYPGMEQMSVSNVSLKINKGETIAIVGENGAGKTSLIKLITGLYTPTEGKVLIGGLDTSKVISKNIYKNISAVFQKYAKYKMTLGENISISSNKERFFKDNKDIKEKLQLAVEKSDLEINEEKFNKGFDTMLSREFDGIDLSGGQWQRIAIARGFYKDHNMIVLDEPTAAIDPVEETKIYNKFAEMSKGKTAIIVTHRLGSAKIADRIVVMDKGKIIEIGTHEELINSKGKYSEMYESQSKWYMDKKVIV